MRHNKNRAACPDIHCIRVRHPFVAVFENPLRIYKCRSKYFLILRRLDFFYVSIQLEWMNGHKKGVTLFVSLACTFHWFELAGDGAVYMPNLVFIFVHFQCGWMAIDALCSWTPLELHNATVETLLLVLLLLEMEIRCFFTV